MIDYCNPFSLEGKKILVTGASSGIGRAIAVEASKMGATLVITGRNKARLEETLGMLIGGNHSSFSGDLSDEKDIESLTDLLPQLDGCVSNAGIIRYALAQFAEKQDILDMFNINLFSHILLIKNLLQKRKIAKKGSIVFTSSISGLLCSSPGESLYSASKAAINGYIKSLALELAGKGIRVNAVNPGVIDTNLFSESELTPEQLEEKKKQYPLKRFGKPEDVAFAAVYLLSDASQWVTGTNMVIDGGYSLT